MSVSIGMIGIMATQKLLYDIEDTSFREDFVNLFKRDCNSREQNCDPFKVEPQLKIRQILDDAADNPVSYRASFVKLSQDYTIENVRPYKDFQIITLDLDFILIPTSNIYMEPSKPFVIDFINKITEERFSKVFSDFEIQ